MKYRLPKNARAQLAQVMTPEWLASRLARMLSGEGENWLELGCGDGALARACLSTGHVGKYVGVDIDRALLSRMPSDCRVVPTLVDVLSPANLRRALPRYEFDRTVGNPPFGLARLSTLARERIEAVCPGVSGVDHWFQLEAYFVLESLEHLRDDGEAAFVVSAAVATDQRLCRFREYLMSQARSLACYTLPHDTFEAMAEVQTFLLVVRKGRPAAKWVTLGRIDRCSAEPLNSLRVRTTAAIRNLDCGFHEFESLNRKLMRQPGTVSLAELCVDVRRGSRSRRQFQDLSITHFHTSDFPEDDDQVRFGRDPDQGFNMATMDDILVSRVGTRCLDRQVLVVRGRRHYTEAVFRLRAPKGVLTRVADWVLSEQGKDWRRSAARGSCARHLTVETLLAMPVPR